MNPPSRRRIALIVATLVALVVVIASFGAPLPRRPFSSVSLNNPSVAASDGSVTAIVTDKARRVLLINESAELVATINYETFEAPLEIATDVCVSNNRVYVAGFKRERNSESIARERIVAYDLDGKQQDIVYEIDGRGIFQQIYSLDDAEDGVIFSLLSLPDSYESEMRGVLSFQKIDGGDVHEIDSVELTSSTIMDVSYSAEAHAAATLSYRGVINDEDFDAVSSFPDRLYSAICIADDGSVFACDFLSGELCRISADGSEISTVANDVAYSGLDSNGGLLCGISRKSHSVRLMDINGKVLADYSTVSPTRYVSLRVVCLWLSISYLVCLLLVVAYKYVRRLLAEGRSYEVVAACGSLAVVLAVATAMGSTSLYSYREKVADRKNEIGAYADYLNGIAGMLAEPLGDCSRKRLFPSDEELSPEQLNAYSNALLSITLLYEGANENGIDMYVIMYGKEPDGIYVLMDSLDEYVWGETVERSSTLSIVEETFDARESPRETFEGTSRYDDTVFRTVYIPSAKEGGSGIVIEIGSRMNSFTSLVQLNLARNVFSLLVLMLVIYMAYSELLACGKCVSRYHRMQVSGEAGAISALARPVALIVMMLSSIDGVMSTLIAKDLLEVSVSQNVVSLVAVPAIMLGIGQALGQGVYGTLGSKVPLRKLMTRGALVMFLCAILAAVTVVIRSFWAYCAAKLLLSIPSGLLYTAAYSLRRHAVTDEQRELAQAGVKRSDTSSAALGTALGGYAAHGLGNTWVYVIIALVSLAVIVMSLRLIPTGMLPPEDDRDFSEQERLRIRRFPFSPVPLAIVFFIILPAVVATGYASFLFPLFSSEMGFEKADINNMYLFGQLIVYVSISSIDYISRRLSNWVVGFSSIAGLALVFLAFSLNTTVVWGAIVIVLVGLLAKAASVWKPLYIKAAGNADVPLGWATGAMFVAGSCCSIAKPFFLGGLAMAGQQTIIILGMFFLVCATAFFLSTRGENL